MRRALTSSKRFSTESRVARTSASFLSALGELLLLGAQRVGDEPRPELIRLALELRRPLRRLGLPLQRPQP